jgi:virulence factor Mce-like protein
MNRSGSQSIVANPVLVGAVTVLVVVVAVFLAYNANAGLPFVPTKELNVELTNGSNLVKGNDVREGGFRVGVVEDLKPVTLRDGTAAAELKLKLDKAVGTIPRDSRITIRPRSALGLKYVNLERGHSKAEFADGDTMPLNQTKVPVQFDDIFKIFDKPTRDASVKNLDGFGDAFAGRGADINTAIQSLPRLLRSLQPVAATLADDNTNIRRFFSELGDAARIVAPLSAVQARFFTEAATTFEAFSRDPEALKQTISKSPGTLDVSTVSLRVQRPFLAHTASFSADLRAAAHELRGALPIVNPALERGTPVLIRSQELNSDLKGALGALRDLGRAPSTGIGLRALTDTVETLNPMVRYLGPHVTVCNYWNYFWVQVADHLSEAVGDGTAQRALLNSAGKQDNSVDSAGAYRPANGQGYVSASSFRGAPQVLHGQPYGAAINNDGTADCEQGQRGYLAGPLHAFGDQTQHAVTDPHTPGSQGPTYRGRARVPAGETFTREPTTGAQLDPAYTTGIFSGDRK